VNVLVTGGYGYIGGHLVRALVDAGNDVTVLDSMHSPRKWSFNPSKVAVLTDSVTNADAVARALHGVGMVYHLAARKDFDPSYRHPTRVFGTNVLGTSTLLAMARGAGVDRVVVTSCWHVYGNVVEATEDGPKEPVNTYGCSKLAMEAACADAINYGMNVVVLRLFSVWGGEFSPSIVDAIAHGKATLSGDGNATRDFVHISDVVEALLQARLWDAGIYNIGTTVEASSNSVWSILHPDELPSYADYPPGYVDVDRCCASMDRTYKSTKWLPKVLLHTLSRKELLQRCES